MSGTRPPLRRQSLEIPAPMAQAQPQPVRPVAAGEVGMGRAAALAGLGARLERLTAQLHDRADRETIEAAWAAGTEAAEADPSVRMEGGGALYRTAFNRAAVDSAARRLEVMARQELSGLAERHAADPEAFIAGATRWRDETAQSLPAIARASFQQRFDALALPMANAVREQQRRRVADDALSSMAAVLPARLADVERAAGQALADPQAWTAARRIEDQTVAELVALGPREAFQAGGRSWPADPSRAGALSAVEVTQRIEALRQTRDFALAEAAWRAAGGGLAWIEQFERGGAARVSPFAQREASQGRMLATPERLRARVPEAWQPHLARAAAETGLPVALLAALAGHESGGRADAVSPKGAVGPMQILPSTAADPGLPGVPPLPREALTDPARAIPWGARYLAALRDRFDGDLGRALAAYNAGMGRVERAARGEQPLPQEARDYLATLLPAIPAQDGLNSAERGRIAARLRAMEAQDRAATREGETLRRAELDRRMAENLAAIAQQGRPVHVLTEAEIAAAGRDPVQVLERERMAMEGHAAAELARTTADPAALRDLAARFAPGTANFSADPAAAVRLLNHLAQRGVQIEGAALQERIRDLTVEAEASGERRAITAEEGAAAGLPPERVAAINRELELAADRGALRRQAAALPEAEREAFLARFPLTGPDARRNAERVQATVQAFEARDRAVREDAAGYAMAGSPALRDLAQRVQGGELAALPEFVRGLRAEQERLGIAAERRRDLPKPFVEAFYQRIANSPDADAAWGALGALREALGLPGLRRTLAEWRMEGEGRDDRRRAIAVAGAIMDRDEAVSRQILRGAFALRDNPPPEALRRDVQTALDLHLGPALERRPEARADIAAAALAAGAALAAARGRSAEPLRRADLAGVLERLAPVASYNGRLTLLPEGMSERAFLDVMDALPPERLAGAVAADGRPITPAMVARGGFQLEAVGPGRYVLRHGGRDVLDANRPGGAFVLDLNGAAPLRDDPTPGARFRASERALEEEARRRRQGLRLEPAEQAR